LRIARLVGIVVLGLAFVALPTIFALFPSFGILPLSDRVRILVGWLVVAAVAGWVATFADEELHSKLDAQRAVAEVAQHRAVLRERLEGLLTGASGMPPQYNVTIYAPSPDGAFLIPVFPRVVSLTDPAIFPKGAGAVGKAWESPDGVFVVTGSGVSNDEHGLTPLQQVCFRHYQVVAAAVISDADDVPIGVASAIARTHDGYFDEGAGGVEELRALADEVAWIMPEAIRWMLPIGEEVTL
jgi:hypothetical protein